ncbi:CDGSH iron-sulfur domain-containing protein NEET [Malus sylvestris]|uniref:CDGSH iron-sulfur domain-containing protein NEET n=1 Tax=Malus sylvestris TaxID=3752 RepID=UPI0021ACA531|nr:CDGSH iron-sulfur domain-containing protein NEET [Malus sylvestris]
MASIVSTAGFISCGGLNRSSGRSSTTFGTQLTYPVSSSFGGGCIRRLKPAVVVVRAEAQHINPEIRKGEEKVVDTVLVPELSKPLTVYCRCWRSGTFPLCDGSHVKHNKATGDNVGPLLVKKQ